MCHLTRMLPNETYGYSVRSDVQLEPQPISDGADLKCIL